MESARESQQKEATMKELSIIASKDNKQIKRAVKLASDRSFRCEEGLFLAEGRRLCQDILNSALCPKQIFITEELLQKGECEELVDSAEEAFTIDNELAKKLSDTQTPQGVFCVFPFPGSRLDPEKIDGNKLVILSSLQDPGNVGTVIRTAEAFGVDAVILSKDCPDIYSPKLLRATMGGIFRMKVAVSEDICQTITRLRERKIAVYALALQESSIEIENIDFTAPSAIVIGNEGNGLSKDVINCCTASALIPMFGKAESLNAAAAASIAIWEMGRPT